MARRRRISSIDGIVGDNINYKDPEKILELIEEIQEEAGVLPALAQKINVVRQAYKHQVKLGTIDSLTGLYNKRGIIDFLEREIKKIERFYHNQFPSLQREKPSLTPPRFIAVAMIDLDYFKSINDVFGHSVGDYMLQAFADQFSGDASLIRAGDAIGRYGGEEFLLVMPFNTLRTPYEIIKGKLEKILNNTNLISIPEEFCNDPVTGERIDHYATRETMIRTRDAHDKKNILLELNPDQAANMQITGQMPRGYLDGREFSFSGGVYIHCPTENELFSSDTLSYEAIIEKIVERADKAAYTAKALGRNQISTFREYEIQKQSKSRKHLAIKAD